ncbi:MAG: hypothetical protein HYZ81_16575 [Nitrospinae bacterium]|nr:hypothetical protein [Nitrospinota bacterium]
MAGKRFLTLFLVASFIASLGLIGGLGTSEAWATSHEKKATKPMAQGQRMQKKPAMGARPAAAAQPIPMQQPRTLDEYVRFVQTKLELEAAKVKQSGAADLKLTIGKDGSVKQTEVMRLDGPPALRDRIMPMVNQMGKLPPLPADANADVLVVRSLVTFNYPGGDLLDPFVPGRRGGG